MKASKGFTLIEVIVSVLITAVLVSSVFSVSLTSTRSNVRADRRLIAAQVSRSLTSTLQDYVTADNSAGTINGIISGPAGGASAWKLPGDGAAYALSVGSHTLVPPPYYVPPWFASSPYNAQVIYYVTYIGATPDSQTPWIDVTVTWTEP